MVIKEVGKYEVLKDIGSRNSISIKTLPKGYIITVTQVDKNHHKIIGPDFFDWKHWDLPVRRVY